MMVRVNGLQTGLTDADLDAIAAAKPDAIMLPKAEGGASVIHADAKLAVREAQYGLPDGAIKILPIATETAAALFVAGTFAGASARLIGLTWGAEDLSADIGAQPIATRRAIFSIPIAWRACCALPAPPPRRCRRSTPSMSISATPLAFAANARRPAATVSSARWRSIRRRCRSSTRSSRRPLTAIERAQAIVDAFAASPGAGVVGIGGVMYDRPHLARAEQVLARAATKN